MRWSFSADDATDAQGMRQAFVAYLRARGTDEGDYAGAELVFGELVGNVVRHAPGPIDIELDWSGPAPVLRVSDRGPGFRLREQLPADIMQESGRGLFLASLFTEQLTVRHIADDGSQVVAVLPLRRRAGADERVASR